MSYVFSFLKIISLFTITGLSLFRIAPRAIQEIRLWADRLLLALLTGIAFYTIFFFLAMGLVGLPLTETTVWGTFLAVILVGAGFEIYRRKKQAGASTRSVFVGIRRNIFIVIGLGLIFYFALHVRLQNGLRYPDKLLDADPYRHHIRTEALMETGYLSKYDPYLVGQVPIFELQGCYILAGVVGLAGPFSAWKLWQWGGQVFGSLSVISLYLLAKFSLRHILERDLGPPPSSRKNREPPFVLDADLVGSFLGLIAAALLAASPVHILRTNAGFSEAYAIPMLAPTLLFYLWAAQKRIWGDFVWFGVFYSALAFGNPQPAAFLLPFLTVHAVFVFFKTRDFRWILGNLLAAGIFFSCLLVWRWKFLAVPLDITFEATRQAGSAGIQKMTSKALNFQQKFGMAWNSFSQELFRNLGYFNVNGKISAYVFRLFRWIPDKFARFYDILVLGFATFGSVWVLRDPEKKKWDWNESSSFFFMLYFIFLTLLLLVPLVGISFTDKYYRYLLPLSLGLSMSSAYFFWRVVYFLRKKSSQRVTALVAVTLLALLIAREGKTWGGWVLNCSPAEYAAADWIRKNTQASDFIIANWYTGDYMRSLTKRRIIISNYPRTEVRAAKAKYPLEIPILPNDPQKVVEYIQKHPGTYYLLQSKWGPWADYEANPHFKLLESFPGAAREGAKIYKIESEAESMPAHDLYN
ncbi:MAG TPA: hypothetical protein DF383_06755 [Deltaproteobacteria bacterium]|nr:hypothetical protein [Deltaproteobacteria bacterium]